MKAEKLKKDVAITELLGFSRTMIALMENSFHKGQAGQPQEVARKVSILAEFDAREEFAHELRISLRPAVAKFASFDRTINALKSLGVDTRTTSEEVIDVATTYRSVFRETYSAMYAEAFLS